MLWKDRNGRMHSTTNLLPQTNTDDFIENTKIVAEKTGNLDLWHEMFGDEEEWRSSLDDNDWTQLRRLMYEQSGFNKDLPQNNFQFIQNKACKKMSGRQLRRDAARRNKTGKADYRLTYETLGFKWRVSSLLNNTAPGTSWLATNFNPN